MGEISKCQQFVDTWTQRGIRNAYLQLPPKLRGMIFWDYSGLGGIWSIYVGRCNHIIQEGYRFCPLCGIALQNVNHNKFKTIELKDEQIKDFVWNKRNPSN
jgi:hypothetical protein